VTARKFGSSLVWLLLACACSMQGVCKVGDETTCPPEAMCYGGKKAKAGDAGVCIFKPAIHRFGPLEAPHGATLRIQGVGFGVDASKNSVTLNGVPAAILWASETEMEVEVPKNRHSTGLVQVSVGERVATSEEAFTYVLTATVSTFAGSTQGFEDAPKGPGTAARFNNPHGIASDTAGNLYVTDYDSHTIRKITPQGEVSTFAGNGKTSHNATDGTGEGARFYRPHDIALDKEGNLYVADTWNERIRKVSSSRAVTTLAGGAQPGFVNNPPSGNVVPFAYPVGITLDANNHLYVVEINSHRIRKITQQGEVTTFAGSTAGYANGVGTAAQFNQPHGIAVDAEGNLYVTEYAGHRIRKITPQGEVTTFAGDGWQGDVNGPRESARFNRPEGIVVDTKTGDLYVTEESNHRIRRISPTGRVSTLAGNEINGDADGIGGAAQFHFPRGITIDAEGNLYVADSGNHRIRKVVLE